MAEVLATQDFSAVGSPMVQTMKRIAIAAGVLLASAAAVAGLGAPANATNTPPPPWVLYQSFNWPDACSSAGYAGEQAGRWTDYLCDEIQAPSGDGPGLVDLYVIF